MNSLRLLTLSLVIVLLAGCGAFKPFQTACAKPEDFAAAVDAGPLRVPAGRDSPDTRASLRIPPLESPEAPRPAESPCLDTPPKFAQAPPKQP